MQHDNDLHRLFAGFGQILVHALTRDAAHGLLEGEMDWHVTRFEGQD